MRKVEFDIHDLTRLEFFLGLIISVWFLIYTWDPLWMIAIFVLEGAAGILLIFKLEEKKYLEQKNNDRE